MKIKYYIMNDEMQTNDMIIVCIVVILFATFFTQKRKILRQNQRFFSFWLVHLLSNKLLSNKLSIPDNCGQFFCHGPLPLWVLVGYYCGVWLLLTNDIKVDCLIFLITCDSQFLTWKILKDQLEHANHTRLS